MKSRINYRSKKNITIIVIICILAIIAIIGSIAFIKGNKNATAAMTDENNSQSETTDNDNQDNTNNQENSDLEVNSNNDNNNQDNNNQDNNNQDNNNQNNNDNNSNNDDNNNNQDNNNNSNNNQNNNTNTGNNNNRTTTSTSSANVPNQSYVQETRIPGEDRLVLENTTVGWSAIPLAAKNYIASININKPEIEISKFAYVNGESQENAPVKTIAQQGEEITYVIKAHNKSNIDAKNITIIDKVPEGTTLVENSITENGIIDKNGKITWEVDIPAKKEGTEEIKEIKVQFKVKVVTDKSTTITNIAIVNGKTTDEVNTPIVTTEKKVEVIDKDGNIVERNVKVGEKLRYTITITNNSQYAGTTTVTDVVPEGTTLVENSINENGIIDGNGKITWNNISVEANSKKILWFEVTVNEDRKESVKNIAIVGDTETNETTTQVSNINTIKSSKESNTPLHELDTITYTLTSTNTGDGEGSVKVSDTIPEGTTLIESIKLKGDSKEYTEEELESGILVKLESGETKTIIFTVRINPFKEANKTIVNAEAKQDGDPIDGTEDRVEKEYASVSGTKTWIDPEDTTHPTITINLLRDGKEFKSTTLENGTTTYSFTDLDKYDLEDGHIYEYTTTENEVEGYTSKQEGYNFTNTINQDNTVAVSGTKTWIDPEGTTHPTITINLLKDGEKVASKQLENGTTTYSFTDLDKYDLEDGHIYEYTTTENEVEGYTSKQEGYNFTNTIKQEKISVSGTKTWIDPEGTTHPTITINLLRDGKEFKSTTLENEKTEYSFTDLDKYDLEDGHIYEYTTTENEVEGYTSKQEGYNFTNTIKQEKISVSGTKTWIDPEGTTHPTITINLLKDGEKVASKQLENGTTTYSFTDLDKYDLEDGHIYEYTTTENEVEGYTSKQEGYNFTNTIKQEKISVSGTKTWIDPEGTTHPTITINLLRDGKEFKSTTLENEKTEYSFTDLDKYDLEDGHIYEYTTTENEVEGYTSKQEGYNFTNTIKQEKISVSGTKTWIDPEGTTHPTITINLLRDGKEFKSTTLENGTTTYSFTDLDKYDLEDGHIYEYTTTENEVEGYTSKQEGYNFTNTIKQEKISVSGTKTWIDPEGTTHPTITINLLKDGEKVASKQLENGTTTYSFTDLDKYDLEDGHIYVYTTTENEVEGYTSKQEGYNFTNTINQDNTVAVSGTKTWIDPEETTHPTITINLLRDGKEIDEKQLENGTTEYSFTDLDKYDLEDGHIYVYTTTENEVEGYTSKQEGYNFTNTIKQEKISVSGTKTWIDPEGTTHPTITINLLRDGKEIDEKQLENGTTEYSFTDLDKYDLEDGHIYVYTTTENEVEGYTSKQEGYNFTNTINQDNTVAVSGTKTWIDPEETTHPTITINLLRDGKEIDEKQLENGTTEYSFTDLDKYDLEDGHIYVYTTTENEVEGYTSKQEGYNFTNTIKQEKISVSGTKTWIDPEGTTHPTITINLLRDGKEIDEKQLENGTTEYSFTDLDKYDLEDGHIYVYTTTENEVEGYTSKQEGYNFTNTINQDNTVAVSGTKTWIDPEGTTHPTITINLLRDGKEFKSTTLENEKTEYSFTDLDKYDLEDGHIYEYTTTENEVEGYTSKQEGYNFTNTINQEQATVSGTKTWISPKDTIHPTIIINLLRDGQKTPLVAELKNGMTTYSFDKLDKYAPDGHIYEYTTTENEVEGYTSKQEGYNFTNTIKQEKISVSGTKTWIDPEGTTHPTITINLLKDGEKVASKQLENGTTTYSFTDLDKYDLEDGHIYEYTTTEDEITGYHLSDQNGYNFTNTINQEKISVNGTKTWIDPEGTNRPAITINLLRDGTEVVASTQLENGATEYSFTDLDKYDLEDGHIYEYTTTEDEVAGYHLSKQEGYNFTNTINQDNTVAVSGTKTWENDPEETKHPTITINLLRNGEKINSTTLENGTTEYSFTNLDKYDLSTGKEYKYTVSEEKVQNYITTYDGYNITNTFKQEIQGKVTITTTSTSEETVTTPLDVVFILDTSGSMNDNSKAPNMVEAVNSAMTTIMENNKDSRVGIVTFAKESRTLLPLDNYTKLNDKGFLICYDNDYSWWEHQYQIQTNVKDFNDVSHTVTGGTFTQSGIKAGAELLTTANTKYTTIINGNSVTLTRTPVIILLSDGDPTYYSANIQDLDKKGNGNVTTENEAYYTITTADYYKKQVTSHYYGNSSTAKSKFYTIGLNMSGTLSKTILNPNEANVDKCNAEGTSYWERNTKGLLYDKLSANGASPYRFSYADASYVGQMSSDDLKGIFDTIIEQNITHTQTRDITLEESNARKVNLTGIDTAKEFELKINSKTYSTLQSAIDSGYVKGNKTDGYYVDLSNLAAGTSVEIKYNK